MSLISDISVCDVGTCTILGRGYSFRYGYGTTWFSAYLSPNNCSTAFYLSVGTNIKFRRRMARIKKFELINRCFVVDK